MSLVYTRGKARPKFSGLQRKLAAAWVIAAAVGTLSAAGAQAQGPRGHSFTNTFGMAFVYVPPGDLIMGSPPSEALRHRDEERHTVLLSEGFYCQTTEVTQEQWGQVMGNNPSAFKSCGADCPVEHVSWEDVQAFISELNRREKAPGYALPTEAQWEFACRAGTRTPFAFGRCLSTGQANYDGDFPYPGCPDGRSRGRPLPVASLAANLWGLNDMHGNVWEWCADWYGRPQTAGPARNPRGPVRGKYRVIRGGSWNFMAHDCRSANRDRAAPHLRLNDLGFRLVFAP